MKSIDALALYLSPFQFESDLDWMSSDEPKVLTISLWFRSSSELGFHFHFQRERNMGTPQKENESKGFFSAMSSRFSVFSNAMHRSVNGYFNSLIHLKTFNFFSHVHASDLYAFFLNPNSVKILSLLLIINNNSNGQII